MAWVPSASNGSNSTTNGYSTAAPFVTRLPRYGRDLSCFGIELIQVQYIHSALSHTSLGTVEGKANLNKLGSRQQSRNFNKTKSHRRGC